MSKKPNKERILPGYESNSPIPGNKPKIEPGKTDPKPKANPEETDQLVKQLQDDKKELKHEISQLKRKWEESQTIIQKLENQSLIQRSENQSFEIDVNGFLCWIDTLDPEKYPAEKTLIWMISKNRKIDLENGKKFGRGMRFVVSTFNSLYQQYLKVKK